MSVRSKRPVAPAVASPKDQVLLSSLLTQIARRAFEPRHQHARPADLRRIWDNLLTGGLALVGLFDQGGAVHLVATESNDARCRRLSRMEQLAVGMAARGAANKEIAHDFHVSTSTVATHLLRALPKLGISSRRSLWIIHAILLGVKDLGKHSIERWARHRPRIRAAEAMSTMAESWGERRRSLLELDWQGHRMTVVSFSPPWMFSDLTGSEREVTWMAVQGLSNLEIARRRRRSARTIANQLSSAFRKLGVNSRGELAAALVSVAGDADRWPQRDTS